MLNEALSQVEEKLRPEVVRIRFSRDEDWSGSPALLFRVGIFDEATRSKDLAALTHRISSEISDSLSLHDLEYWPYFNFRTRSECEEERFKSPEWE